MTRINKERLLMGGVLAALILLSFTQHRSEVGLLAAAVASILGAFLVYLVRFNPFAPGRIQNTRIRSAILLFGAAISFLYAVVTVISKLQAQ
jgi:hypothetical protein